MIAPENVPYLTPHTQHTHAELTVDLGPYPGPLDFPCNPEAADVVCDWWKT